MNADADAEALPQPPPAPAPVALPTQAAARTELARYFLLTATAITGIIAAVFAVWPPPIPRENSLAIALLYALLAPLALAASRLPARWLGHAATAMVLVVIAAIGVSAALLGWGVADPGLGYFSPLVIVVCAMVGVRQGAVVAIAAAVVVGLLGAAQLQQWLPIAAPVAQMPLWMHVLLQWLLITGGFGAGLVITQVLSRYLQAAADRAQRFSGLLRVAADTYWEMTPDFRLSAATLERDGGRVLGPESGVGSVPWELPSFRCAPDVLDELRADLETRQPFRDRPIAWEGAGGRLRHYLISGEPRLNARGVFEGYWGVARDVTPEVQARHALNATETRYQDLFTCLPSALVLHRHGRVLDANPAALTLFGFADLPSAIGANILALVDEGDSRDRARLGLQRLAELPVGDALPVEEFRLTSRSGRGLVVRATSVVVDTADGSATMSILVDDTERRAAEDAVRRSEAMLSHLVASSPDVITLTDLASGRYVMVNQTFERVIGYSMAEVAGRTSIELGVWARESDRAQFVARLREQGRVQDLPTDFVTRTGTTVSMLVSGARFVMDRREFLVINARDVTSIERARLEREAILENASIGIALTRERTFQVVNPAFEEMLGWPAGSLVGQPGACVWATDTAYAEIGARVAPALARGEQIEVESDLRRHDGSLITCRMLARAVDPTHPSRGSTIWIVEDITERRRVDAALARARDDAEAANRAKSAFLANTSHELRTPLNGLLGMAQLARAPGLDDARRALYLDQIVESARGLAQIVSDILDLSKIEAGKLELERKPFDLRMLLASLRSGHGALAAARALKFDLDIEAGIDHVIGDQLRVRQILTNYLSNAIKFTLSGGISLSAWRADAGLVRFEVRDTGPGIDADTLNRLFRPFTQADESTTRRFGGTGLGLSICHELAQRMDGQVGVTSALGRGSTFWVELPLPAADVVDEVTVPDAADREAVQGLHVLVVDDNEINLMVAVAQLEQFGIRVGQATDGQRGLDAIAAAEAAGDPYDLVLMDLQMPVKGGIEVTRELRQRYPREALPIVAFTAAALVTERAEALAAGMDDFIGKPTEPDRLRATVARWARVRHAG